MERANAILDELGLAWDDRQEFRVRSDGDTLSIHIDYYQLEEKMEVGVELIKQFWEEIGIEVATRAVDGPLFGQRRVAGELDVFIWNFDQNTEIGFHGRPTFHMPPPGERYGLGMPGFNSGGEQGEEPPAEVIRWMELAEEFQQYPMGNPRYMEIGKELLTVGGKQPVGHRHRRHHAQADDRQGQPAQREGRWRSVHLLLPVLDDLSPGAVVLRAVARCR